MGERENMRTLKIVIPTSVLAIGFAVCTSSVKATPAYAKKEGKSCTYCHTKVSSNKEEMAKGLNAVGTCYKDNDHSLAKCEVPKK
jgi:uncharacterized protein with PIN domain